ncbi:transporter [Maribellus comscasis]|uniref:Transporter n=1 Tax=Maribellus comscasis TaxID=2681766 RepID=A0A6I6JS24_9BACT|nr:TolC family protein [Maribellus comscasis]QGY45796.1 transporter [Maribellus comscasis]
MKKIIVAIISILVFNPSLFSQNPIESVLKEIEKNNTTLSALQKRAEAEQIGNKTNIYLQNPEVEFDYLWGNDIIGNEKYFSATQSFDFPTAYNYKKEISNIKNEQVELEYQKQLKDLLLDARLTAYELVYTNAMISELSKRLNHAQSIAKSYKTKLDAGEANILEFNKAQLNLLNLNKELESLNIEREALLGELTRLNGGIPIKFNVNEFPTTSISADFEQWCAQAEQSNPMLNWLKKEMEASEKQVGLNRAMSLPKFKTGYMSENVIGQKFQGITLGLSIPLWENKNKVKYARANAAAMEKTANDQKVQFYNRLKLLHAKAIGLQNNANDYKSKLQTFDSSELLKKALDKGEISLIDYILELSIYYESVNNLLELKRDMNITIAELNQYL